LPSQYTTRQIIQKLASTLQAKRFSHKEGQCFRLLVVATHRDCVVFWKRKERVREFDRALAGEFTASLRKELIFY
jgi:hypothetical protein